MRWCVHRYRAFHQWSFGSRTRTRLDSNLYVCVCRSRFFFLRVLSLDTSSSTYFPLFQLALPPPPPQVRLTATIDRSSISPPRNHVAFSFAKQVNFEHSLCSSSLLLLREGKKSIHANDGQMTRQKVFPQAVVDRSSTRRDRDRRQLQSATSLARASLGTVPLHSQMHMLRIAGHGKRSTNSTLQICGKSYEHTPSNIAKHTHTYNSV